MSTDRDAWRNKHILIMGLGRFGGGVGVARFLAQRGAKVRVTDRASRSDLRESLARLDDLAIDYRLGEHRVEDFTQADLVVVNPAVPPGNEYVEAARAAGVPLTSEIRLLAQSLPAGPKQVVGITGSAGKSTVTAMVGHVLNETLPAGRKVWVGGNLGGSLLPHVDDIKPDDVVVLELSSFMLEGLREDRWSPHVAVVTTFTDNHLDWHGSRDNYLRAKQALLDFQQPADIAILGPGLEELFPTQPGVSLLTPLSGSSEAAHGRLKNGLETPAQSKPATTNDSPTAPEASKLTILPGQHNQANAQLALAAIEAVGVDAEAARIALLTFTGLPHRLQLVAEHNDVRYFNDSKSTTPEAARIAIDSFPPGTVHAILGGSDKGSDLAPLARHAATQCHAIYTIGQTGDAIADAAEADATPRATAIHRCGDLESAMRTAMPNLRQGDVLLLSPGCASWDQFTNYGARGRLFGELVFRFTTETDMTPPPPPSPV